MGRLPSRDAAKHGVHGRCNRMIPFKEDRTCSDVGKLAQESVRTTVPISIPLPRFVGGSFVPAGILGVQSPVTRSLGR